MNADSRTKKFSRAAHPRYRARVSVADDMRGAAAEFFAGMGLVRMALESCDSPYRVVYANDIDPTKARLYRAMFPGDDHFDQRDIAEVRAEDIPPAELWTASFPCTDLSLAGGRAGIRGGQSGAVWEFLRLIRETPADRKPRLLIFENVIGLLSSHGGEDFRAFVNALNDLEYGVDVMRINAYHFAPQSRPRLFLLATSLHDAPARVDPNALTPTEIRPRMVIDAMRQAPNAHWHARTCSALPQRKTTLKDIIESLPPDDARWWPRERAEYFRAQIHPNHVEKAESLQRDNAISHVTAFRRVRAFDGVKRSVAELRFDGVAGCLRTPKGGSAKQILVELGHGEMRVRHLTAVECMRLQGVSSPRPANATEDELLFALGDAVCVPAARWAIEQFNQPGAPSTIFTLDEAPMRSAPASNMAIASS